MVRTNGKTTDIGSRRKLICLVRHGKAMPQDVGLSDFERALDERGRRECEKVARLLAGRSLAIDRLISSPADRALETAHIFAKALDYPVLSIVIDRLFYDSESAVTYTQYFQQLDDSIAGVALFGHNPSFDRMLAHLTGSSDRGMEKGGVAAIEFAVDRWTEVGKGKGLVVLWISPTNGIEHDS